MALLPIVHGWLLLPPHAEDAENSSPCIPSPRPPREAIFESVNAYPALSHYRTTALTHFVDQNIARNTVRPRNRNMSPSTTRYGSHDEPAQSYEIRTGEPVYGARMAYTDRPLT